MSNPQEKDSSRPLSVVALVAASGCRSRSQAGRARRANEHRRAPAGRNAVHLGHRSGARSRTSTRSGPATRPGRSGFSTRHCSATTRSRTRFIPWLATSGKWVGRSYVVTLRERRHLERREAVDRSGREVHVRDRQARGLAVLDDVEDGPAEHHHERATSSSSTSRARPNYQDWDTNMYSIPIVPRHIWSSYSATEITTGQRRQEASSAPARSSTARGKGTSQTLQWNRRDGWWATKAFGHEDADEVHRRHPQHGEHGIAAELPAEQDRPEQQLLPGHRQADRRQDRARTTRRRRTCSPPTRPGWCRTRRRSR